METQDQQLPNTLEDSLLRCPGRFDFFQAVRVLEGVILRHANGEAIENGVRFKAAPSHGFPASAIVELFRVTERKQDRAGWNMVVAFMGLYGPAGVLPPHYTRLLLDRLRKRDHNMEAFLDLFNHRIIALFFRSWEKCRLPIAYEHAQRAGDGPDIFTKCLYSLIGFGTEGLRGRMKFGDDALLFYAGLFADHHRSSVCLRNLLEDYFGVPVAVVPFQGEWLELGLEDRSSFPDDNNPEGHHARLGMDMILGDRVWDVQGMFRLRVGPLTRRQFRHWIPKDDGGTLRPFGQLVRTYVGLGLQFDVQVVLKGPEIPCCLLSESNDNDVLLGWTTWLLSDEAGGYHEDSQDAIFRLDDI